ncbi:MAG: NAD(P)H-hydrate dehydratase [Kofleriaceae bacterium]
MQYVLTAAEARALDAATIAELGLPGVVLMEAAGRGVAAVVLRELAARPGPVAVVCGGGGNGGDGFVVTRVLRAAGVDVTAVVVIDPRAVAGDAAIHYRALVRGGGPLVEVTARAALDLALAGAAIVVDAVFGIGVTRPVTGWLAEVIAAINAAPGRRIAVDVPSGVDADTGQIRGCAVRADLTVAMALPKLGTVVAPGCAWAGAVECVDIGVAPRLVTAVAPRAARIEAADVARWLRPVEPLAHKFRRGHVLVIGGSPGKRGAARLTAQAALRSGAGLVTLAGPADDGGELAAPDPIMTAVIDDAAAVAALLAGKGAVAIGPGMPDDDRGAAWLTAVIAAGLPTVIDATGLGHLAAGRVALPAAHGPIVLTPHSGEAARILGERAADVEADRPAAARALAAATGCVVLLKGAGTIVCDGGDGAGRLVINSTGGPALATAGSGDVLAGVIAALLAHGHPAAQAASLGAYLHGVAGDRAALSRDAGVIATDLLDALAAPPR